MAVDRDYLAEKVWQNTMIPAYSFVPPGIGGYEPRPVDYSEKSQIDREDEAKKILAELGYGPDKPLKMEIRYNTSENHKNTAVAIQEQLKPLGIEVTLLNTDTKTHYGHLEQKGDFDIARAGIRPARPLPYDLKATATVSGKGVTLRFEGDTDPVRQVRVGRQQNGTTRIVLETGTIASYSIYPLYQPFRLVVDCVKPPTAGPVRASVVSRPRPAARFRPRRSGPAPRRSPAYRRAPAAP